MHNDPQRMAVPDVDLSRTAEESPEAQVEEPPERNRGRSGTHTSTDAAPTSVPPFELRPSLGGHGLYALRAWKAGEAVSSITLTNVRGFPDRWTFMRDIDAHGDASPPELAYLQHGCDPNAVVDLDAEVLRAARDIAPGDLITVFYPATEWSMAERFSCMCGSPACLGWIEGASALPLDVLGRYQLSSGVRRLLAARRAAEAVEPVPVDHSHSEGPL